MKTSSRAHPQYLAALKPNGEYHTLHEVIESLGATRTDCKRVRAQIYRKLAEHGWPDKHSITLLVPSSSKAYITNFYLKVRV